MSSGAHNMQGLQIALRKTAMKLAPERAFIAASDIGINLALLPGSGSAENIWFAVVQEADKNGKLGALTSWLQQDYPNDVHLKLIQTGLVTGDIIVPPENDPPSVGLSAAQARRLLVSLSTGLTCILLLFLSIGPAVGYQLRYPDVPRCIEIVVPTLVGYVSNATVYFISGQERSADLRYPTVLVVAPLAVVTVAIAASLFAFGWTNREGAANGQGISPDTLAHVLTGCMAILSLTTTVLSNHLFAREIRR